MNPRHVLYTEWGLNGSEGPPSCVQVIAERSAIIAWRATLEKSPDDDVRIFHRYVLMTWPWDSAQPPRASTLECPHEEANAAIRWAVNYAEGLRLERQAAAHIGGAR